MGCDYGSDGGFDLGVTNGNIFKSISFARILFG